MNKTVSVVRSLCSFLAALTFLLTSSVAVGYTIDTASSQSPITGLWWNQNESGWGVTLTQQFDVIFVTMFVYDNTGNPTWYVASDCAVAGAGCTGTLYKATGGQMPTTTWNGPITVAGAGTITLAFTDTNTGTMNYTINGAAGSKAITRQVFRTAPGSTPTTPGVVTVPVQTAMANLINNGYSKTYALSGWINNSTDANPVPNTPITGSGTLTVGSPTRVIFTGGPLVGTYALKSVAVMTGTATGTTTTYYNTSNYTIVATFDGTNATYYSPYSYPATVHAGSTGSLGSGSDGKPFATSVTTTYVVASDSNTTLLATLIETVSSAGGGQTQTQTVYRIDTSGGISLVSAIVQFISGSSVYKSLTYTF